MMRIERASHQRTAARRKSMLQRALPIRRPRIAAGERLKARALVRALADHALRLLRWLGELFAAGGPLS
jgi:hypothetical protein